MGRYSSVGHYYDMMYHFRCVLITRPAKNKNGWCLEYCREVDHLAALAPATSRFSNALKRSQTLQTYNSTY